MYEQHQDRPERQPLHPRIYVASLADYNAGRLHGAWLAADQAVDDLQEQSEAMLGASRERGAEEYAVHDYEDFAGIRLDEATSLATIARLATGLARHGPAFAALVAWLGIADATEEAFDNHYRGSWQSVQDYAADLLDELGVDQYLADVPDWLRPYVTVDIAGFARDLELGGDIYAAEDDLQVHIFDAHA
jgi:antirestriction protein